MDNGWFFLSTQQLNDIRKTVARPVPTKTQEPPAARPAAKSGEKKKRFSFGKKNAE